jgi:hypothetical protein
MKKIAHGLGHVALWGYLESTESLYGLVGGFAANYYGYRLGGVLTAS